MFIHTKTRYWTHLALIIVCIFMACPALYALQVATLTVEEAFDVPPRLFPPSDDFLNNVENLFNSQDFDQLLWNTIVAASVTVVVKTALAMLAGLAFVYYRFPGKIFLFFFVLLTILMPTEIIFVPLFNLMQKLEWGAKFPKLALTVPFLATATGVFLFRQHFSNIPRELVEAAQMDGATPLRFLYAVLLPMSWNVIGAHVVIQFIYMWHQYAWPLFVVSPEEQLIQVGVRNATTSGGQTDFGLLMTAGIIASLPPLILFLLLQRQFMNGFALTRDK